MIKLRPHHLLCTQGYSGKGYSKEFVNNMDLVVNSIKQEKAKIELVFSKDDICTKCPNLLKNSYCQSDNVSIIDNKVVKYFNLKEQVYVYEDIVNYIKDNMSEDIMNDICGTCEWYSISNCKKRMVE